jgi:hypothetical protein
MRSRSDLRGVNLRQQNRAKWRLNVHLEESIFNRLLAPILFLRFKDAKERIAFTVFSKTQPYPRPVTFALPQCYKFVKLKLSMIASIQQETSHTTTPPTLL